MRRLPRICVSLVLRSIAARRALHKRPLNLVDVFENRHGVLLLEQPDQFVAARSGLCATIPMNGTPAARGGARVIHGIADIPELASGLHALDRQQAFGRGLAIASHHPRR